MTTFIVTITELKIHTSHILNQVYYQKKIALVKRHGTIIARIMPVEEKLANKP